MTDVKKAKVTESEGFQVVVLPEGIHLDGDEVLISQDERSGQVAISTVESDNPWTAIFAEIDAIPVTDEDWQRFEDDLENVRTVPIARARILFEDDGWA